MKNVVVYTAIFGDNVKLYPQPRIPGIDFVCFSDRPRSVKGWDVRVVERAFGDDPVRNNRYYKIRPHLFFPEYEYSIYIDGNFVILKSPLDIISQMEEFNMLAFDHNQTTTDPRNCIYKEYDAIIDLFNKKGVMKDDLSLIQTQIDLFKEKAYPANNGLIKGGVLIRKHNEPDVIKAMERWWYFIENYSKRDQLSFNYVAWETGLRFKFLPGDIRRGNPWFYMVSKNDKSLRFSLLKYKARRVLRKLF